MMPGMKPVADPKMQMLKTALMKRKEKKKMAGSAQPRGNQVTRGY
jgi:hypothetical protein